MEEVPHTCEVLRSVCTYGFYCEQRLMWLHDSGDWVGGGHQGCTTEFPDSLVCCLPDFNFFPVFFFPSTHPTLHFRMT